MTADSPGALEATARAAAAAHARDPGVGAPFEIPARVRRIRLGLAGACRSLTTAAATSPGAARSAQWLIENRHITREAMRQVAQSLPWGYHRELPVVLRRDGSAPATGPSSGDAAAPQEARATLPRTEAVACAIVACCGGRDDTERARRFLHAYQDVVPLTLGELWALPAFLRLCVLEDMEAAAAPVGAALACEEAVASGILSLRGFETTDWRTFVESVSRVHATLLDDPAGVYGVMDFETRDAYRRSVEQIARWSGRTEEDVARAAADAARAGAPGAAEDDRVRHVGHHLVGRGREAFEQELRCRVPLAVRLRRPSRRAATAAYLSAIAVFTLAGGVATVALAGTWNATAGHELAVGVLAAVPLLTAAVSAVHWMVTHILRPRVLPKLDLRDGIPPDSGAVVVVPGLLTSLSEAEGLARQIETAFVGNGEAGLSFALLTDFGDATAESMPGDDSLLAAARDAIDALNARYGSDARRPFGLFHRRRRWNPAEGCWMGWERKRGKLAEFNRLLLGATDTGLEAVAGFPRPPQSARYVITLDADTLLPPRSARRLIETLSHPLNRPLFDPATERVIDGYTIVQPRIETAPESGARTLFSRIASGDRGLDLYTHAVSDVYQDLFGEAVFTGKGAYDVRAFERSTAARVPANTLLSHDLFEGVHGRVALLTDVVFLEDYPSHALGYAQRLHRWVRGDWQLLPWLARRVPSADGRGAANRLSLLDRWKIIDNLRRSLFAPSLVLLLVAGWLWPLAPITWTVIALAILGAPVAYASLSAAARSIDGGSWHEFLTGGARRVSEDVARWVLAVVFLLYESIVTLDAILRTLVRVFVTRRSLLQWRSAAHVARTLGGAGSRRASWSAMGGSVAVAIVLAVLVVVASPGGLVAASPLLAAWMLAPEIAFLVSRPTRRHHAALAESERRSLRLLARRTWLYFERFAGPDDRWLPPDNFQETAGDGVVAHRTSPTNIGMALLSTVSAYDLGYVGVVEFAGRLVRVFDALDRLERHRGHFLNWYDTRDLSPLEPRYVSTVDSGNLAGCLVAVAQACREAMTAPVPSPALSAGIEDTLAALAAALGRPADAALEGLATRARASGDAVRWRDARPGDVAAALSKLDDRVADLERELLVLLREPARRLDVADIAEIRAWFDRAHHLISSRRAETETLCAWRNSTQAVALSEIPALSMLPDGATPDAARSRAAAEAQRIVRDLERIAARADALVAEMDFGVLYDGNRKLLRIGHDVSSGEPDRNDYDLLASEARLASFLAIAKDDVPVAHWMHLGRPLTRLGGEAVLLSWGGSMFEYLMPRLLMRAPERTLLTRSCRAAVDEQRRFATANGIPWGTSESAYDRVDPHGTYRYRSFGVPGLALAPDVGERFVVAPYASALALWFRPAEVVANLSHLERLGALGRYGMFDAVDFGTSDEPAAEGRVVRCYMAHHQGMILCAVANRVLDEILVRRFHRDPRVRAMELLLHERMPPAAAAPKAARHKPLPSPRLDGPGPVPAWSADMTAPDAHLLGNGRLSVLVTASGGGHARHLDHDLTRWRCDPTLGGSGTWVYLRDVESGDRWSAGLEPRPEGAAGVETRFSAHDAAFRRQDHGITARMEVLVPPHEDVEIRRVTLLNDTDRPRKIGVTSFAEVALAPHAEDLRHPAFAKLFVESRWAPALSALVFHRRSRSPEDRAPWMAHAVTAERSAVEPRFETDRARFVGRGGTPRDPAALVRGGAELSGTTGDTLDPAACIDVEVAIEPHGRVEVAFLTAAGAAESDVLALVDAYRSPVRIAWAFEQARIAGEHLLFVGGIPPDQAPRAQRMFSPLFLPRGAPRPERHGLAPGPVRPRLWAHGVSDDLPVLLVVAAAETDRALVGEVLRAHAWWRRRGAACDVVVLDDVSTGYSSLAQEWLRAEVERGESQEFPPRTGQVFVVRAENLPPADRDALLATAGVVIRSNASAAADVVETGRSLPQFDPASPRPAATPSVAALERASGLVFDNGLGGFTQDGREYVVHLDEGRATPMPWANVVANAGFGFLASESGGGFTWCGNSSENRLTPWANDPVSDRPGEIVYLRDEETAEVWSSTPSPAPGGGPYEVRHGAGHTDFRHRSHGLDQRLELYVDTEAPVKLLRLTLAELHGRPRRITVTCYVEWVLGVTREVSQVRLVPEYDSAGETLLVRNPWSDEFSERVAFLTADRRPHGLTTDRWEFLGPLGDLRRPAALVRVGLAGVVEAGRDVCGALQIHVDLPADATTTVHFVLGQGDDRAHALELARRFRDPAAATASRAAAAQFWDHALGAIKVRTPDPAIDLLASRWLLHQTLTCRVWGRTGVYQSSGAFGFRDQLQDVVALCHATPAITRAHLLDAASRQFPEGDVLHWWHPPLGRGVRTRCSDDLLWLPYAVAAYVEITGDGAILDEPVAFLRGAVLAEKERDRYGSWEVSDEKAPLYEHCLRAVRHADTSGPHGLPLIGTSDWNDGFTRVGVLGIGESVWLAWFLRAVLLAFAPICERRGDAAVAGDMRARADALRDAAEKTAWDGDWYVRAFYDDGTPLGSAHGDEPRIDSVAESWSVLAQPGPMARIRAGLRASRRLHGEASQEEADDRRRRAMQSVWDRLVDERLGLVRLLHPPFQPGGRDPGYIGQYPPGTRENGAQYTHAAVWVGWAYVALGDADRAARVLACLHPLRRCADAAGAAAYGGEPYVLAGDVHAEPPHAGRAGWTWYTGAAGWTYRFVLEAILGVVIRDGRLRIAPCVPADWPGFEVEIRRGAARYLVRVETPGGSSGEVVATSLDGAPATDAEVDLVDDGRLHEIVAVAGAPRVASR